MPQERRTGLLAALLPVLLPVLLLVLGPRAGRAQGGGGGEEDARYRALALVAARGEYEQASAEWRRARALRARDLLSEAELEAREAARGRARVELLRAALRALDDAPHLLIARAVKRRLADGGAEVELVLAGSSAGSPAVARLLRELAPEIGAELAAHEAGRVFVSLKASPGADGAMIATPYERAIPRLAGGATARARFRLVRDAADVVVSIAREGHIEERRILLETEASGTGVALQATQLAQEGDLGAQAAFDVVLLRVRDDVDEARLDVEGLPAAVAAELREGSSNARLTTVRFAPGERERRLRVLVTLPRAPAAGVRVDSALRFAVTARAARPPGAAPPDDRVEGIERVALELVPRGVPRVELRLARLYAEVADGGEVTLRGTLRNVGSRALAGVRPRLEAPAGWRAVARPDVVATLAVGAEAPIALALAPGAGAAAGDYEARVDVEGGAGDRPLDAEPRVVRVRVTEAPVRLPLWGGLALLAALAVMAAWGGRRLLAR